MKFFSASALLAFGAALSGVFAAPAPASEEIAKRDVELAERNDLEYRGACEPCALISGLYKDVKVYTKSINITIEKHIDIDISYSKKIVIIKEIQGHCGGIISTIHGFIAALIKLKLNAIHLIAAELAFIVKVFIQIILEIVFTLLHVIWVLKISILQLLGTLIFSFINVIFQFIAVLVKSFFGIFVLIKEVLTIHIHVIQLCFPGFYIPKY